MIPPAAIWHLHVLAGIAVAVTLTVMGAGLLRRLVRANVSWWPIVAAPLLLYGPAVGFLVGSLLDDGTILPGAEPGRWAANMGWTILVFFAATTALAMVRSFLRSRLVREELHIEIPDLMLDGARYLLWIVMVFVVVGVIWGRTEWFSPLFTASAVGTVILGFALQETLANFFAGMSLLAERVYAIGDWVWIGDIEGQVMRVSRRSTQIRTRTNDLLTLSNRSVASAVLRNQSKPDPVHAEFLSVAAPYDAPPQKVKDALEAAVRECPGVLRDPAPRFRLRTYADSGIEYQIKIFLTDLGTMPDIKSEVMVAIWYHFRRAGISFPFPVREVRRLPPAAAPEILSAEAVQKRLAAVDFFRALPPQELAALAYGATTVHFGAGERIVRQGDAGNACYVVDRGRVAVYVVEGDAERKLVELGPGDLFGEMSLLTGEPRTATVRAVGETRLVEVASPALAGVLERSPDLTTRLAEAAVMRKEGLAAARARFDSEAKARMARETVRLGALIRRFLHLPGTRDTTS